MPEYLAPGVYIQEQPFAPRRLVGAPTSRAAFVGVTASGPRLTPTLVRSFGDFEREFAGGGDALVVGRSGRPFALGVRGYFQNGGRELVVVRVRSSEVEELEDALQTLEAVEEVATVAAPAAAYPRRTYAPLIAHAEAKQRMALLDAPRGASVGELLQVRSTFDSSCAAFYAPRLVVQDAPRLRLAPSSFVAGVFARVDASRGVWKAPAGEALHAVAALGQAFDDSDQTQLNPQGINVLRSFTGKGLLVWGARTASSDPERRYVNVQRTLQFVSLTLERGLSWTVFEPNDEPLWVQIRASVEEFLGALWREGALAGAKPSDAYFVRCDRSTMTQADIDAGRAIVQLGLALLRPAEFIVMRSAARTA